MRFLRHKLSIKNMSPWGHNWAIRCLWPRHNYTLWSNVVVFQCCFPGSEEGAEQAREAVLKETGKVTDIVSSLGFSWWQGGPPHTQSLKDLHWVSNTGSTVGCSDYIVSLMIPIHNQSNISQLRMTHFHDFLADIGPVRNCFFLNFDDFISLK